MKAVSPFVLYSDSGVPLVPESTALTVGVAKIPARPSWSIPQIVPRQRESTEQPKHSFLFLWWINMLHFMHMCDWCACVAVHADPCRPGRMLAWIM